MTKRKEMPVHKNEAPNTWYAKFYYTNHAGKCLSVASPKRSILIGKMPYLWNVCQTFIYTKQILFFVRS